MCETAWHNAHQKDYLPVKGLPALREAVVDWVQRTEGLDYSPDNVLVGPGTKELMFLVQLVYYGELVIPSPSWVSYAPQARIIGRQIHWLRTRPENGLGVEPEALESSAPGPGPPAPADPELAEQPHRLSYNAEQLQALAEVLRKYRVLALSDEIYSGTHYTDGHVSLARYYPEGTIISNGLSKWCGAGGWRLGFFVFPRALSWLADAMAAVASETFTSTSAPIQYAAVRAFEDRPEMHQLPAAQSAHPRRAGRPCLPDADRGRRGAEPGGRWFLPVSAFRDASRRAWRAAASTTARTSANACSRKPGSRCCPATASVARRKSCRCAWPSSISTATRALAESRQRKRSMRTSSSAIVSASPPPIERMAEWAAVLDSGRTTTVPSTARTSQSVHYPTC